MKTFTIYGSMKYSTEMKDIAWKLEADCGYNVIQCIYNENDDEISELKIKNIVQAHNRKIDLSDCVYIVDINNYIGKSTKSEIEYAKSIGKEVIYHSEFSRYL